MKTTIQKDILIVTIYGRGHWLALECQKNGYDVALLDLTPLMKGEWSLEDQEGPFGVFESKRLMPSHIARLTDEGPLVLNERGYTIWLKDGPLELKGPLGAFRSKQIGISESLKEYFLVADGLSLQISDIASQVEHLPFEENWLAHLAHQISASVFIRNTKGLHFGTPLPLMNSFYYRRFHKRQTVHSQLSDAIFLPSLKKDLGLHIKEGRLEDIAYQKNKHIQAHQVIWMLSSTETSFFWNQQAREFFPNGAITPQWYWTKYRICFDEKDVLESLPDHFVMIEDIVLPWVYDNLSILQKTLKKGIMDAWIRLSSSKRFEREAIKHYGQVLCGHLQKRMPNVQVSVQDWPKEMQENAESYLGPSVFGVYDLKERSSLKKTPLKNVIFEGPEIWTSLSWNGQFRTNKNTLQSVISVMK